MEGERVIAMEAKISWTSKVYTCGYHPSTGPCATAARLGWAHTLLFYTVIVIHTVA